MARKQNKPLKAKLNTDHPFFDIIEDAYQAFNYDTPASTEVCENCCMDDDIEADFFNPAIRALPLHYLQDWYFAAYDPKGVSKHTWGYLLPRILEVLSADEEPANVGLEVSLSRFQTGVRDNWNDAEWSVLDRFQRVYLDREVRRATEYLDDTVCMFGLAGWPLEDLIQQVAAFPDEVLARRFWNDWCAGRASIWITAFWDDGSIANANNFYTSRALFDRMEALAFKQTADPELAEKALAVASVIEANAAWAQRR